MIDLLIMLEQMALNGYGVAWHNLHNEYRPFSVEEDNTIEWWHDPEECGSVDFSTAVQAAHEEMLRHGP